MMTKKQQIILVLVGMLFLAPAFAGLGVGISPSGGTWNFGRQGGTIQLQVINTGNEDAEYTVAFTKCNNLVCKDSSGNPITYGDKWAKITENKKVIKAQDFAVFYVKLVPDSTIEFNKKYVLLITATPRPFSVDSVSGSGTQTNLYAQAGLDVVFSPTITGPTDYVSVNEAETRANRKKTQVNYLPLVITVALILLLIAALFVFLFLKRKKEKGNSGDIIVEQKAPPK